MNLRKKENRVTLNGRSRLFDSLEANMIQTLRGLPVVVFLALATPAVAQGDVLFQIAKQYGHDQICNLRTYPRINGKVSPKSSDERIRLYLRCESRGGADEFTSNSCCDHLTSADGNRISVCPDRPPEVIVPLRQQLAQLIGCD
jgi:hypothetical protein